MFGCLYVWHLHILCVTYNGRYSFGLINALEWRALKAFNRRQTDRKTERQAAAEQQIALQLYSENNKDNNTELAALMLPSEATGVDVILKVIFKRFWGSAQLSSLILFNGIFAF